MTDGREHPADLMRSALEELYRTESRRVLATLIRLIGDFDRAEEAVQEAFSRAVASWSVDGLPSNPRAWLVSAGRFSWLDRQRRRARFDQAEHLVTDAMYSGQDSTVREFDDEHVADDQLRLIFTCCHPSLSADAQIALTLREVCRLTTEEIAHAFFVSPSTVAQRIVRAKSKIRSARIPYELPERSQLNERLDSVLRVVYLVFNEGYLASHGEQLLRADVSQEAIRLCRLLRELITDAEADGLLALMLLHESRRQTRLSSDGELVLLEDQDRSRWNTALIVEGKELVHRSLASGRFGVYTLQAAISAVHASATTSDATDWRQIVALYDVIARADSSPVVLLNRAVAVAMRDSPEAGLVLIDDIMADGVLSDYHLAHAARADLLRRLGRHADALAAYTRALELTMQEPERRFLERRVKELP